MKTSAVPELLERQIEHATEFAGNDPLIVYLDPADEDNCAAPWHQLRRARFRLSEYSFGGGTRAVIPPSNILIDNSFATKLEEAKRRISRLTEQEVDHGHDLENRHHLRHQRPSSVM